jgi:hypothetical protein
MLERLQCLWQTMRARLLLLESSSVQGGVLQMAAVAAFPSSCEL